MTKPYDPLHRVVIASASSLVGIWRYGPFAIRRSTRIYSDLKCELGACSDLRDPLETRTYSNLFKS